MGDWRQCGDSLVVVLGNEPVHVALATYENPIGKRPDREVTVRSQMTRRVVRTPIGAMVLVALCSRYAAKNLAVRVSYEGLA